MSRVRSSLRSYALLGETPQRTLELTDRKVGYFELGAMITVACAVSHPPYETFRLSSAGHPAPLVSQPDAVPYFAEVPADLPLGVDSGSERRGALVRLRPGGVLVMYTDGLVERRGESIDVGLARLQRAVAPDEPETICRSVMHRQVASSVPEDDIAVLALRRDPR
jgi:serine phosphatase RsbU (regulator of sigma subunit)